MSSSNSNNSTPASDSSVEKVGGRMRGNVVDLLENAPEGYIDYKNVAFLARFLSEGGRMIPTRVTNIGFKVQRKVRVAIMRARIIGLLPFVRK